jgi:hypothetical protein
VDRPAHQLLATELVDKFRRVAALRPKQLIDDVGQGGGKRSIRSLRGSSSTDDSNLVMLRLSSMPYSCMAIYAAGTDMMSENTRCFSNHYSKRSKRGEPTSAVRCKSPIIRQVKNVSEGCERLKQEWRFPVLLLPVKPTWVEWCERLDRAPAVSFRGHSRPYACYIPHETSSYLPAVHD